MSVYMDTTSKKIEFKAGAAIGNLKNDEIKIEIGQSQIIMGSDAIMLICGNSQIIMSSGGKINIKGS